MLKNEELEYRYYSVDDSFPILPLIGNRWESYGSRGETPVKMHFHNVMEIGCCHKGEGFIYVEDKKIPYSNGTITIFPKNVIHDTISKVGSMNFWEYVFVDEDAIMDKFGLKSFENGNLFIGIESSYYVGNDNTDMVDGVHALLKEFKNRENYYKEKANLITLNLFYSFSRVIAPSFINNDIIKNRSTILNALDYINNKYDESVTVASLAKKFNMSEPYFRKIFKSIVGKSPLEHINKVRIQKACVLLLREEESIINVAMMCGFSSVSTFNRNFIRYVGCTPSTYRGNHTLYRGTEKFTMENYPTW